MFKIDVGALGESVSIWRAKDTVLIFKLKVDLNVLVLNGSDFGWIKCCLMFHHTKYDV